ncbi:unnamed protein product [Heligmosomoides polygyrus]|uniref:SAM domain-containing protein n=1 Tax=Heligmosomoides polygyrus TaxID=6339 RepID=A0A183GTT6_HELPZ|nr:unnamed protein product [Heligmosomoides polygyrus]
MRLAEGSDHEELQSEPTTFGVLNGLETRASAFRVWHGLYNRFDEGLLPRENTMDMVMTSMEHVGVLEGHIAALRNRIAELKCQLGRGGTGSGNSMADSGHSSGIGQSEERLAAGDHRPPSRESGIYEQSMSLSEEALTRFPLRWQSLRDATHCSSKACRAEFASSVDRRIHCHRCGKVPSSLVPHYWSHRNTSCESGTLGRHRGTSSKLGRLLNNVGDMCSQPGRALCDIGDSSSESGPVFRDIGDTSSQPERPLRDIGDMSSKPRRVLNDVDNTSSEIGRSLSRRR